LGLRFNIAVVTALALTLLGLAIGYGYARWDSDRRAAFWVDHAHRVIEETLTTYPEMQEVALTEQKFLLSDGKGSLNDYERAVATIRRTEANLAGLVVDNPDQTQAINRARRSADAWLEGHARIIALAQHGHADEARLMMAAGVLRPLATRLHDDTDLVAANERKVLLIRTDALRRSHDLNSFIALSMAIIAAAGLVGMIAVLGLTNERLHRAIQEAARSRQERDTSQALTDALFSQIPDYLLVMDIEPDDRFSVADINPALAKAFGVSRDAVRGKTLDTLFDPRAAERVMNRYRRVRDSGEPYLYRGHITVPPNETRIWESMLAPIVDSTGAVRRIVGAIRDVTEQTRAETRLRDSQRMEAIGQLTGGVAHDFNNLLQVIRGNLELLLPAVENDPAARRRVEHAILGADRAAQLTTQLLAFARRQPLTPEVIDLARLALEMSELLKRTLGESILMETAVAPDLWPTIADTAQVESAILNLALNARAAMPGGGKLTLRFDNTVLGAAEAAEMELEGQEFVVIEVGDTGEGMTPEVLSRAFEPFFTTKGNGKGTGLGLSMVYGFVRQSKGAVRIESRLNAGTRVFIWLPRAQVVEAAVEAPQAA
jgi:PAS domain S-box-containing protein